MRYRVDSPIFQENFDRLIQFLDLKPGSKVVDLGCGKGRFLVELAKRYQICGVGVDVNPDQIAAAEQARSLECPQADISFMLADVGAGTIPGGGTYDVASYIGINAGFSGWESMADLVVPGGRLVIGMPYWAKKPDWKYYRELGKDESEKNFRTLTGSTDAFLKDGFAVDYIFTASQQEYDYYQSLAWKNRPGESPERMRAARLLHTAWLREYHGWGIWILRKQD